MRRDSVEADRETENSGAAVENVVWIVLAIIQNICLEQA